MEIDTDLAIRVAAFAFGVFGTLHYLLGANALRKASPFTKLLLFPALVAACVGLCLAAVLSGSGMVALVCMPLAALILIKDAVIWRAGAYMSDVLHQQAEIKELRRQSYNVMRRDMEVPVEELVDIVKPSGYGELLKMQRREKDRAS